MTPRSKRNLETAMQAEAFASAKFARFAAGARKDHDESLASLFQDAADVDRFQHFAQHAEMAGLAADGADENLNQAIEQVIRQIGMYDTFTREAWADGDGCAKAHFERIRNDEVTQLMAFRAARQINTKDPEDEIVMVAGA